MSDTDVSLDEIKEALLESQALLLKLRVAEARELQVKQEVKEAIESIRLQAQAGEAEQTKKIIEVSKVVAEAKQALVEQQKAAKAKFGIDINLLMAQPSGGSTRL